MILNRWRVANAGGRHALTNGRDFKGYRAAPAEVLYPKLPDPSVCIIANKLGVLLGGSLLQLPGPLLLLLGIQNCLPLLPWKDLVQGDLSRLVQAIPHGWLGWSAIILWVNLHPERTKIVLDELACRSIT